MKKSLLTAVLCLAFVSASLVAADRPAPSASSTHFYGKIAALDAGAKMVTVHNKRQNADAKFRWDDATVITLSKKSVAPSEMKTGQVLMVAYVTENNENRATKIVLRAPSKFGK